MSPWETPTNVSHWGCPPPSNLTRPPDFLWWNIKHVTSRVQTNLTYLNCWHTLVCTDKPCEWEWDWWTGGEEGGGHQGGGTQQNKKGGNTPKMEVWKKDRDQDEWRVTKYVKTTVKYLVLAQGKVESLAWAKVKVESWVWAQCRVGSLFLAHSRFGV